MNAPFLSTKLNVYIDLDNREGARVIYIYKKGNQYRWKKNIKVFLPEVRKWEMPAATKVKMRGSEKDGNSDTYDISSIKRLTRKFVEVWRCSRAKQRQRNVQKKCAARANFCFFG